MASGERRDADVDDDTDAAMLCVRWQKQSGDGAGDRGEGRCDGGDGGGA